MFAQELPSNALTSCNSECSLHTVITHMISVLEHGWCAMCHTEITWVIVWLQCATCNQDLCVQVYTHICSLHNHWIFIVEGQPFPLDPIDLWPNAVGRQYDCLPMLLHRLGLGSCFDQYMRSWKSGSECWRFWERGGSLVPACETGLLSMYWQDALASFRAKAVAPPAVRCGCPVGFRQPPYLPANHWLVLFAC